MGNEDSQEIIQEDTSQKSTKRKMRKEFKILLAIFALCAVTYIGGVVYFNDIFLTNTTINHIDVSYMTLEDAHDVLQKKLENHQLNLTFIDNEVETIKQNDSSIQYNKNNHLNDLLENQNRWLWFVHFFQGESLSLDDALQVDKKQLSKTLDSLQHMEKDKQVAPKNAKVTFSDNAFQIVKESNGSTLLKDKLQDLVIDAFLQNKNTLVLLDAGAYDLPKIKSDDKNLKTLLNLANQYCHAHITYETISGPIVLDENELLTWIYQDENGTYSYNEEFFKTKATEFVKGLAEKINNIGTTRTYTLAHGRRVTVGGGNYGLKLRQKKEVEGLIQDILAKKKETRTPVTSGVQASTSNNGLGNTFVQVDLTNQKVYLVKNGIVTLSTDCVTGKYTDPERRTPAGTYYLYAKQRNRILRGTRLPDGSWPYESPVDYWMPFNRGVGLHDADWRSSFGGNIYYNSGSHGCINLPVNVAGTLYNSIKVNTPVVCHY